MPITWAEYDWFEPVQVSISESKRYTLRGLHSQAGPHAQNKILYVLDGVIRDVLVHKETGATQEYGLSTGEGLYVPRDFFHGFSVLSTSATIMYLVDKAYAPDREITLNPFSEELMINWGIPEEAAVMSDKDRESQSFGEWKDSN